ncbi:MAG: hypothetical protein FWF02_12950 [Micrococcales bacterium]|nr:hypothetical protein [Micrococcales bacterium]MCL2668582.1 hypothetical protein [Micrococcales bacterium]
MRRLRAWLVVLGLWLGLWAVISSLTFLEWRSGRLRSGPDDAPLVCDTKPDLTGLGLGEQIRLFADRHPDMVILFVCFAVIPVVGYAMHHGRDVSCPTDRARDELVAQARVSGERGRPG